MAERIFFNWKSNILLPFYLYIFDIPANITVLQQGSEGILTFQKLVSLQMYRMRGGEV